MILCIGTTPAAQRVMIFKHVVIDAVNRAADTLDGAAGKSINVAKVLRALGEEVVATGFLGGDHGRAIERLLSARGVELDFVAVSSPTRQCVTVIDQSAATVTELVEESRPVELEAYEKLMAIVRRRVPGCRAVVMSGTIASGGPPDLYARCTRLAHEAGVLTVVDASGPALLEALKARPGLVKPNRAELQATTDRPVANENDARSAMRDLCERGASRVVVTAGRDAILAFDGRVFWRMNTPRVQALNPIGSGDSFTAGLVWRLVRGDDLGEACRWAAAAGAANALNPMAGELDRADVDSLAAAVRVERLAD